MIDRFNFYDVYGYLLPGGLLLVLLWLPLGLLLGQWPAADLGSAVLALGLAYIAGHVLHALSEPAFPCKFKHSKKKFYPSYLLLDKAGEQALPLRFRLGDLKYRLGAQIQRQFGIQIGVDGPPRDDLVTRRAEAFFKCRGFLIEKKMADYAEQQQGMYVLLRGIAAAGMLAFTSYLGFALAYWFDGRTLPDWVPAHLSAVLILGLFVSAAFSLHSQHDEIARQWLFWILAVTLLFVSLHVAKNVAMEGPRGFAQAAKLEAKLQSETDLTKYLEGERTLSRLRGPNQIHEHKVVLMSALAVLAITLSLLCRSASQAFAVNFAHTVYHDFSELVAPPNEDIRARAYQIYEQQGKPSGKAEEHWLQAEKELRGG